MSIEHLDVLIVGAGLSGICAGHYVQTSTPWASYAIFEGRDAIGGTWDLFRYPGVRSDSDMFTLGYSFRPWAGDDTLADGDAIRSYVEATAADEHIDAKIRFGHRVTAASWSTADARWKVTAERTDTGERFELTCGFLFSCTGYYRYDHGYQPDFPGVDDYAGVVVHPQQWPEDLDYAGKRVVIIGSGATAVTLVPAMADTAGHVTMLQRSPTYIVPISSRNPIVRIGRRLGDRRIAHEAIRWGLITTSVANYRLSRRYPTAARKLMRRMQEKALPAGFDIDTHLTPTYDPWDQRVCAVPDGDLFAELAAGRASIVTDHVESFTETGIRLRSGEHLPADVVVTATGLEMLFLGGIELDVDGTQIDPAQKLTYKGMMLQDVPNLALAVGYTNASWTLKAELTCQYVAALLTRMHETGFRQCIVHADADADGGSQALLPLQSGYIQRAAGKFPRQGRAFPWQVHQNYFRDYRAIRFSQIEDDAMQFSNRPPAPVGFGRRSTADLVDSASVS